MGLDLKKLGIRSLSAAVFVVLLMGSLLWNFYSFSIFFFIVSVLALNEFFKIGPKLNLHPYKIAGFIAGILLYIHFAYVSFFCGPQEQLLALFLPLAFVILAAGTFSKEPDSVKNALYTIGGVMYAVLPFALLNLCVWHRQFSDVGVHTVNFEPRKILGVILLIWSNDTFAYLGGSLLGKNKMIERISPGKTWEGTVIGVLITFAFSFFFGRFLIDVEIGPGIDLWPVLGIIVPVLATIGDLAESKLKREAGIKDSGNIMPGHGGILDRFDSLIFVSPFAFALLS